MKSPAKFSAILLCLAAGAMAQTSPVPWLNQPLVPSVVRPGSGGFTLTVNGAGFVAGSVVEWNGSPRATTFVSGSQLMAAILAGDVASAATGSVRVTNPGTQAPSNAVYLPVTLSLPMTAFAAAALPISGSANDVTLGDLDNDGIPDMAACQEVAGMVSLYKGAANGQFTFLASYKVTGISAGCDRVIMADLNGDGKLDMIASNGTSLAVFLGNGDGTLQAKTNWITGGGPVDIVAADFNRDGKLDLATANFRNGTVSALLGNGDGTFQPRRDYGSIPSAQSVVAGDFNRDGILDLASTSESNGQAMILLGNGDGTFQPPIGYAAGTNAGPLASADLNGDGFLDLFVTDNGHGSAVLLGNGDGTFQPPRLFGGAGSDDRPLLQDVNGDGNLDAVFGNSGIGAKSGFQLLYGNGDGTFQPPISFSGPGKAGAAAADLNGDGLMDFIFAAFNTVTLLPQTTDEVNPGKLDFGSVKIGTSMQQSATLTNFGASDISIQSISVIGVNKADYAISGGTCGTVLASGQSCTLAVTFTPTLMRSEIARVVITDSAPGPLFIQVSGSGI